MEFEDHLAAIEREAVTLVAALRGTPLTNPVPSCKDWTARELAKHVGLSTGFWIDVMCDGAGRDKAGSTPFPEGDSSAAADWVESQFALMTSMMHGLGGSQPCWFWIEGHENFAGIARRWANETAVHRVDAQLAATGEHSPIDADLAVDGMEEIFVMAELLRERRGQSDPEADAAIGLSGTLHLCASDRAGEGDGEWLLSVRGDGFDIERTHAEGDCSIEGAVSDIELTLYQRPPSGAVAISGDQSVLDAWYRLFTF